MCVWTTGVPFFDAVFSVLDCDVVWNVTEGDFIQPVCEAASVTGKVLIMMITIY